jgi:S-methylmethionine-dependent homocysteine/selenocysteine methylase
MSTSTSPQREGVRFLTDAGCETDLIFNRGVPVPEFAAHTLLADDRGRTALADYYRGFLELAADSGWGMVLDAPTWKAHPVWADDLGTDADGLAAANRAAVAFSSRLRDEYAGRVSHVVVNGLVGPRGDAYAPTTLLTADEAQDYHREQIGWLADAGADQVTALTFTHTAEAVGAVRAAGQVGIPIVVSFTIETDGTLPSGQPLGAAFEELDEKTDGAAAYLMINCAHPDHVRTALGGPWATRVRSVRCNASRASHAELDAAEVLDDGDPVEFAEAHAKLMTMLPDLTVIGGCCGSDLRHVTEVVRALS